MKYSKNDKLLLLKIKKEKKLFHYIKKIANVINVIVKFLHVVVSVVVQKINNIYRLEQEFPSLVQKQAKKNDLETIKRETNNYQYTTSRLLN